MEAKEKSMIVFGPFESTIYKLRNTYRMKILIKYKNTRNSRRMLHTILSRYDSAGNGQSTLTIDINPGLI